MGSDAWKAGELMNGIIPRTLGSLRGGDHICSLYHADAEHDAILCTFVVGGLERNQRVLYFTDEQPTAPVITRLEASGIDARRHIAQRRLSVATSRESYLASGSFDPDACIRGWLDTAERAILDGYSGIRVGGDLGWATRDVPGAEHLLDYERRIQSEVFQSGLVTGMCEVDCRLFDDAAVEQLLGLHPDGVVRADFSLDDGALHVLPTSDPPGARIFGEIDVRTAGDFEQALRPLRSARSDIYLDFAGVPFLGTTALHALVRFASSLEGQRCVVVNMAPKFRKLVDLIGLGGVSQLVFGEGPAGESRV